MAIGELVSAYRIDKTSLILPTIYEDTLSYLEQLKKISMHFNALLDIVDKDGNDIDKLQSDLMALTNNYNALVVKVNGLEITVESELNKIKNDITNNRKDTLQRLAELKEYVDNGDKKLKEDMETLKTYLLIAISKAENDANLYTDLKIDTLRTLHDMDIDAINKRIDNINQEFNSVYNPITGKKDSIDDVVMYLYRYLRDNCVSAVEYDTLGLSAKEYDDIGMSALDYDLCSYLILYGRNNKMFSPFTGKYVPTKEVIRDLFDAININGKSAKEYDDMQISAVDFDKSDFNAYQQDTNKYYQSEPDDKYPIVYNSDTVGHKLLVRNPNGLVQGGFTFDFTVEDIMIVVDTDASKQQEFFTRGNVTIANDLTNTVTVTKNVSDSGTTITIDYSDLQPTDNLAVVAIYEVANNNPIKQKGE